MTQTRPRTWVLVADSTHARVVKWVGRDEPLEAVDGFNLQSPHPHSRDIMSDRPGRIHESHGPTRHSIEPHTDPVREAERRFAETVVQALNERHARHEFDRLVLVMGPRTMGVVRLLLPADLQKCVRSELLKDLVHLTNTELKEHLLAAEII